jgi:hypothetical protein
MKKDLDNNLKDKKNKTTEKKNNWLYIVLVMTFVLSIIFSFISNKAIVNLDIVPSIIILVVVVFVGIIFDLIGIAVTVGNEEDFHAQASKKIKGSKTAIKLIRNSAKVSNFCADVIGDICGVLSGGIGAVIALKLINEYGFSTNAQIIIAALISSITVGGKAVTKEIAKKKSTKIIGGICKIISVFEKD